jgi:hypothetical protein
MIPESRPFDGDICRRGRRSESDDDEGEPPGLGRGGGTKPSLCFSLHSAMTLRRSARSLADSDEVELALPERDDGCRERTSAKDVD